MERRGGKDSAACFQRHLKKKKKKKDARAKKEEWVCRGMGGGGEYGKCK
jgi:hypothetical protein